VGGVDRLLLGEGEGLEGPIPGQAGLLQAVGEAALLAVACLLAQERQQHRRRGVAGLLGRIEDALQALGHAGEAQLAEQGTDVLTHQSVSGIWKNTPRTCLRISDSRRLRS
jgi:hypothetical protein